MNDFFDPGEASGPVLSNALVHSAEERLGVRLPDAYVTLLRARNGGRPRRRCFRTSRPTSWADDHIEVSGLLGIGYDTGIDGQYGSRYMIREWGYPDIGVVVCDMPSAGHDTVMLDYSESGPTGEPRVVYVDDDRSVLLLAPTFRDFVRALLSCSEFRALPDTLLA